MVNTKRLSVSLTIFCSFDTIPEVSVNQNHSKQPGIKILSLVMANFDAPGYSRRLRHRRMWRV